MINLINWLIVWRSLLYIVSINYEEVILLDWTPLHL